MTYPDVIIVDDEAAHREQLVIRLGKLFPELKILATCASASEATIAIAQKAPSLVFLDVEMPGMTGFEFLESLHDINFQVIFTTSHAAHAVQAFRVAAIDFLLKPYSDEALQSAVQRVIENQQQNQKDRLGVLMQNFGSHSEMKIALPTATGYLFVRISEVIRLEAHNTLTTFFFKDKSQVVVSRTMKECEEMLIENGFVRIHQSHMINMAHIRKFNRTDGGTVEMDDGALVEVSRRKKEEFLEALRKL